MSTILHEFRYALRQLRKSPGFALVAILTLALGIGANIAVFSVTNAVLLNPSGIPHADGLVALRARYQDPPDLNNISMSAPDFADAADGKDIFSSAAIMQPGSYNFSRENNNPELLNGARVSSGYFDTFQARPYLGRVFAPEEDVPGANHEMVLSYRAWKKRFGGDPNIVGQTLVLNQQSYRVLGVMGPDFNWPNQAELWTPIALPPARFHDQNYRYNENLFAVGRLRPGVTLQQANTYLERKAQENIASEGEQKLWPHQRMGHVLDAADRVHWRQPAQAAHHAADCGGHGAADRLRQYRRTADCARLGAAARPGNPRRSGRAAGALAAPGAGGKYRADRSRSLAWFSGGDQRRRRCC